MMQSASMNRALKNVGPFNRWMDYFDVDELFQIKIVTNISINSIPLASLLDQHFPESQYSGGVQFHNCPISCFMNQTDIIASRYKLLFEKCRHIQMKRDCQLRAKLFIRPRNVPIMHNIHQFERGIKFANRLKSASFAEFRHYHYGTVASIASQVEKIDTSMDIFIKDLKARIITYSR